MVLVVVVLLAVLVSHAFRTKQHEICVSQRKCNHHQHMYYIYMFEMLPRFDACSDLDDSAEHCARSKWPPLSLSPPVNYVAFDLAN